MVDLWLVAVGVLVTVLFGATAYAASEYYKQLKRAQKEYEKARDFVEDIVLSFNRELKREAERIEQVDYKIEGASSRADSGLRKIDTIEARVAPMESQINQLNADIDAINDVMSKNVEALQKLTTADPKMQELEASQETLKSKLAELEQQLQRIAVSPETAPTEQLMPTPVIPIKRDKAISALTDTEIIVLEFLTAEGPKTAPEIKEKVQLSREHTARLMKKLYEEGYLERETGKLPFKYSVKKEMETFLKKPETPAT